MSGAPSGFLLVDKAAGVTSHDVVAAVRRLAPGKVGHAGSLDPMATGLLVLGIGRSTRLLRFIQHLEKEYVARAVFGVATDTLDADGAILSREPMNVDESDVRTALDRFRGEIMQIPPMVSARKVEGRRLYEIAREGREVDREARPVTIVELELTEFAPSNFPEVTFRVVCTTGTYVRTLADDLARSLGGRAHLDQLRRVRNGSLDVADAINIAEADASEIKQAIVDPAEALADLPAVTAGNDLGDAVRHGLAMPTAAMGGRTDAGLVRILDTSGELLAVYRLEGGMARAEVVTA